MANDDAPGLAPYCSQDRFGLLADVHHVGHGHLHAEGQLVLADPRQGLGIAELGQLVLVELPQRVEGAAAVGAVHPLGIADVEDRVAHGPALHALIDAGQKAGAPEGLAAGRVGPAADQDDEAGQVLVLRAQAIGDPRAHRGPAVAGRAGVEEQLGRRMVELVGVHRLDDGDVVDDAAEVRPELADDRAALAAFLRTCTASPAAWGAP